MAHPICVAEQAIRNFINLWFSGLQPTLCLQTNADGSIFIKSEVISSSSIVPGPSVAYTYRSNLRRRSGLPSRCRRRKYREIRNNPTRKEANDVYVSDCQPSSTAPQIKADCFPSAKPNLATTNVASAAVDIAPDEFKKRPKLTTIRQPFISIPPRTIHHPAVINACFAILGKHPSQLTPDEADEFQQ